MSDLLRQLETNLKLLRRQQAELEQEAILLTGLPRIRADLTLEEQIKPKIREYEREYQQEQKRWQAFVEESPISEEQAKVIIAEIIEGVTAIELHQPAMLPDGKLQILRELKDVAEQPLPSPVAKVKVALSLAPPFFSMTYEQEIAREKLLKEWFPTYTGMYRSLAKALAKK